MSFALHVYAKMPMRGLPLCRLYALYLGGSLHLMRLATRGCGLVGCTAIFESRYELPSMLRILHLPHSTRLRWKWRKDFPLYRALCELPGSGGGAIFKMETGVYTGLLLYPL